MKKSGKKKESDQPTISGLINTTKKYETQHPRQISITQSLVSFIAEDLISLSVVESSGFRLFANSLDPKYQLPSRKHLSQFLIKDQCDMLFVNVKKHLEEVSEISLTIDLWSNCQMKAFTGITGHYIFDWQLHKCVLACRRLKGRHTAENVYQEYEDTVFRFKVAEKVKHIITDNASNMKKGFRLPGYEVEKDETDEDDDEDDDDSNESLLDEGRDVTNLLPIQHHWCFAHTLQLIIKDGFKASGHIGSTISKCSRLVSFVRKSTIASEDLEGKKYCSWQMQHVGTPN